MLLGRGGHSEPLVFWGAQVRTCALTGGEEALVPRRKGGAD